MRHQIQQLSVIMHNSEQVSCLLYNPADSPVGKTKKILTQVSVEIFFTCKLIIVILLIHVSVLRLLRYTTRVDGTQSCFQ